MRLLLLILLTTTIASCQMEQADLIVHNARIYTLADADPLATQQAMAIRGGKVLEVGPERQILNKYVADKTLDAQQKTIFPGLIDGHCHFLGYGLNLGKVNLLGTQSFEEVLARVEAHPNTQTNGWITGRGWDQNDWKSKTFPTNSTLNERYPDTPVLLRRIDGHAAIANQAALDAAGITVDTFVEGGIVEVIDGQLTGILIDNAVDLVLAVIPQPTLEDKKQALLAAQENCFAVGLTTVDDAGLQKEEIELIDALHKSGELKMRVYAMVSDNDANLAHYLKSGPTKSDRLNVRSFKFYADGALGSRGACLMHPYSDVHDSAHFGMMLSEEQHYRERFKQLYDKGFQVNTHCIGDSANRLILGLYAEILQGGNDRRWRIEHAQALDPSDFATFGEFGIFPSVQPTHATSDMYWAGERLGPERIQTAYAYKALNDQLGVLALGTDFPVEDISPIKTFYAAVARKDAEGWPEGGFQPENGLTRIEAIRGMTIGPALANFEEKEKGVLQAGMMADFVILDRDIMKVEEADILSTTVVATYIAGEPVYEKRQ